MILDECVVVKVQPPGGVLVLEILHVQPIDELRTLESWPLVASSRACGPGHDSFASLHGVQPPGVSAMRSCSRLGCSPLSTPLSSRWSRCWSRARPPGEDGSRAGWGPGRDAFASLHGAQLHRGSATRSCCRLGCSPVTTPLSSRWMRCDDVLQGGQTVGEGATCRRSTGGCVRLGKVQKRARASPGYVHD